MSLRWIPVVAAAVVLGSCAQSPEPTSLEARQIAMRTGQCFRGEDVNNVNLKDDHNAYVSTRQGYVYRLESGSDCFGNGVSTVSLPKHRLSNQGICIGEQAAVSTGQARSGLGRQCLALVSGPIFDSRVSGLRSRQG